MTNLLDEPLKDINVKPMRPTKLKRRFNILNFVKNAKLKTTASLVKQNAKDIAEWILNMKISKTTSRILPNKIKNIIKLVNETNYLEKPIFDRDAHLSRESESAFKRNIVVFDMKILNELDCLKQMELLNKRKSELLTEQLQVLKGIKCNETIKVSLEKQGFADGTTIENSFTFTSKAGTITNKNEIAPVLQGMRDDILTRIDRYTMGGSGWTVGAITLHNLRIARYHPLVARSYIALPAGIQNRRATINIRNTDDKCFVYCLGRVLDPKPENNNLDRVSKHLKNVCDELGLNKIKTPVMDKDIPKIEKQYNISINLFGHNGNDIHPIKLTKHLRDKHINLLVTSNNDSTPSSNTMHHYIWIKDFNKLCSNITKFRGKKHFCMQCIQHFTTEEILQKHIPECMAINNVQAVHLPKEGTILKSKCLRESIKIPFVIYADLESLLVNLNDEDNIENKTKKTHKHEACSYGYKVVCCYDDKLSKPFKMFRGLNSISEFFTAIFEEEKEINKMLRQFSRTDMILTNHQKQEYKCANNCYVCKEEFTESNYKVRDHCHVTGNYRGTACNRCNLGMKLSTVIPVVFHNLRGYDSHLLLQELGEFGKSIGIIPNNMEKYMSFSVGTKYSYFNKSADKEVKREIFNLRFIDSFQFMPSSLAQLVSDLKNAALAPADIVDKFKYASQEFGDNVDIMTRKGIYPYTFMNGYDKFDVDPRSLSKNDFTNDLTNEEISDADFRFYLEVCDRFNI